MNFPRKTSNWPRRPQLGVFFVLVALGVVSASTVIAPVPTQAAKAKSTTRKNASPPTTKLKPGAFSPDLLAGKWRWIKSTATVRFKDGTEAVSDVEPVGGSTLTFTRTKSKAGSVIGDFSGQDYQGNPMSGFWGLEGRTLYLTYYGADGAGLTRSISTLSSTRLVMTANDRQVAEPMEKYATGGPKDVVGGSAYDELIRVK